MIVPITTRYKFCADMLIMTSTDNYCMRTKDTEGTNETLKIFMQNMSLVNMKRAPQIMT